MTSADDVTMTFAEAAHVNYERDHSLLPIVAGVGWDGASNIVGLFTQGDDPPRELAEIAAIIYAVSRVDYIVTVTEGWAKIDAREEDLANYEHGDLEAHHAMGDASVHTVLMVATYNLASRPKSYQRVVDADAGYEVLFEGEGPIEGRMAAMMWEGIDIVQANPPPTELWLDNEGRPLDLEGALDIFFGLKARVVRNDPRTS